MENKIANALKEIMNTELSSAIDIDYLNVNNDTTYDEFIEELQDLINNIGVIYYSEAIKYLSENDPSLEESMIILYDMGYEDLSKINSELLATVHYQNMLNEKIGEISELDFYDVIELFDGGR